MIVHNLTGDEGNPIYKKLEVSNGLRHYDFLRSIIDASIETKQPFISQTILKALNFHAIACLHPNAGQYRPCPVQVDGNLNFPQAWQIPDLMDEFTNNVNRNWIETDTLVLAAFVLWRLNRIHPFINGNGRTARAACLYVICVKSGGWLPYSPILPEKIRENRPEYVDILRKVDASEADSAFDIRPLVEFLQRLMNELVSAAGVESDG